MFPLSIIQKAIKLYRMIQYRETIIKKIIEIPDPLFIEPVINNSLQRLMENGTHPFIAIRFIEKLKTSLIEIKAEKVSEKERNNITQALHLLEGYDVKKLTGAKSKDIKE